MSLTTSSLVTRLTSDTYQIRRASINFFVSSCGRLSLFWLHHHGPFYQSVITLWFSCSWWQLTATIVFMSLWWILYMPKRFVSWQTSWVNLTHEQLPGCGSYDWLRFRVFAIATWSSIKPVANKDRELWLVWLVLWLSYGQWSLIAVIWQNTFIGRACWLQGMLVALVGIYCNFGGIVSWLCWSIHSIKLHQVQAALNWVFEQAEEGVLQEWVQETALEIKW